MSIYGTFIAPFLRDNEHGIDTFIKFVSFVIEFISHHAITLPLEYIAARLYGIPITISDDSVIKIMQELPVPGGLVLPFTPSRDRLEGEEEVEEIEEEEEVDGHPVESAVTTPSTRSRAPVPLIKIHEAQTFDQATTIPAGIKRKAITDDQDQLDVRDGRVQKVDPMWSPIAWRPTDPMSSRPVKKRKVRTENPPTTPERPTRSRGPMTRSAAKRKRQDEGDRVEIIPRKVRSVVPVPVATSNS